VPVDIDEDTLKQIAGLTSGQYFRADSADTMRRIYQEIDQMEKSEVEVKKYEHFDELFPQIVLGGLGVLLLEVILGHTVWRKLP
jgi:Ca-activated chloride channel family protein